MYFFFRTHRNFRFMKILKFEYGLAYVSTRSHFFCNIMSKYKATFLFDWTHILKATLNEL